MRRDEDPRQLEFQGAFSGLPRPMDVQMVRDCANAAGLLLAFAALALVPFLLGWVRVPDANRAGLWGVFVVVILSAIAQFGLRAATPQQMERLHPMTVVPLFVIGSLLVAAAVLFAGPTLGASAVFVVEVPLLAFMILRRRWAIASTAFTVVAYGGALALLQNPPVPMQQLLMIATSAAAAGFLVGSLVSQLDEARNSLTRVNGRLRRFLAHQVADAVVAEEDRLSPHRTEIAVCFVDLRGFTAFTNGASPERVVDVLAQYYAAVGAVIDRYDGTIGGFDGDGVFAFLGDPVPKGNAAADALSMAKEIAIALDSHTAEWGLGYGIGLAFGEATVGLVGYEGRLDYTPIGACVNLAARLCSDAKPGEIVIDDALRVTAGAARLRRRDDVDLKGFGSVASYALTADR
jgi:class 3 adenylate cyclase